MSPLSVKKVAAEAAWRCWGLRRELLSVMIIPIAAFLAIGIGASLLNMNSNVPKFMYVGCFLVVSALAAISCHRVLLLGPVSVPKFGVGHLGRRELQFISAVIFLGFIAGVLRLIGELLANSFAGMGNNEGLNFLVGMVAALPAAYIFARLALMLPSIAIETHVRIAEAWQLSRGNGWRLAILVVVVPWLVRTLQWGIATSVPEAAGTIASNTLYAVFLPLEIALLSVSYRHLIE